MSRAEYVVPGLVGFGMVAFILLAVWAALVLSGYPEWQAACDRLHGEMKRSACVLPSGEYVNPLLYEGESK